MVSNCTPINPATRGEQLRSAASGFVRMSTKVSQQEKWSTCGLSAVLKCALVLALLPSTNASIPAPDILLVEAVLAAPRDFGGNHDSFLQASEWHRDQLDKRGYAVVPFILCTAHDRAREARAALEYTLMPSAIRPLSHSVGRDSCFVASVSPTDVASVMVTPGLASAAVLPPNLKLAPGLLDHGFDEADALSNGDEDADSLRTIRGASLQLGSLRGLSLTLSPGTLPCSPEGCGSQVINGWLDELRSKTMDLHKANYWSDPAVTHHDKQSLYIASEWRKAATAVHGFATREQKTVGEVCGLGNVNVRHTHDDHLRVEGLEHFFPGVEASPDADEVKTACLMMLLSHLAARAEVLRVAPLYGARPLNAVASAVVQSATISETPLHEIGLDGSGEVIQVTDTGLDETSCFFADDDGLQVEHGHLYDTPSSDTDATYARYFPYDLSRRKVVQYIELFNTGEDAEVIPEDSPSTSDDAAEPTDDSITNEGPTSVGTDTDSPSGAEAAFSSSPLSTGGYDYSGYSSSTYGDVWSDDPLCDSVLSGEGSYYSSTPSSRRRLFTSSDGLVPSSSSSSNGYHKDAEGGHGTHVAGTAAGSTSARNPYADQDCTVDEGFPACAGGCVPSADVDEYVINGFFNIETACPAYDCDGAGANASSCLGGDVSQTLVDNAGVAPGAKIAFFDLSNDDDSLDSHLAGNYLWNSSFETGAKIHTSSWGASGVCEFSSEDAMYDALMYENPEHLLLFAAGNAGGLKDVDYEPCTIGSPALGKNVLTIGSSSSGATHATTTGLDGRALYDELGYANYTAEGYPYICSEPTLGMPSMSAQAADIDTVSFFSSYGPTNDERIKPELVAPGDRVFSASSDGTDDHSCQLLAFEGTSMATPAVAGAAALVRQYFSNTSFYAYDLEARGLCAETTSSTSSSIFSCFAFAPSAATVKATLINGANLMGGSSEPDNSRGFGRVHLGASLPLDGSGSTALFVVEGTISSNENMSYTFDIDGDSGVEFRSTLCWLDIPTTSMSAQQLQHDLDLTVLSPSGAAYTMWDSGQKDAVNVNERVVVPVDAVESGTYTVIVSAGELLTDSQAYSLVVSAAVLSGETGKSEETSAASLAVPRLLSSLPGVMVSILTVLAVMA